MGSGFLPAPARPDDARGVGRTPHCPLRLHSLISGARLKVEVRFSVFGEVHTMEHHVGATLGARLRAE